MQHGTLTIRPDWRQFIIDELPVIFFAIVLYIIGGLDIPLSSLFFCAALAMTFHAYYRFVLLRGTSYAITAQQLIYERGVFSRNSDYIELYRVLDYDEKRSFMQMLLGLKTVCIHSGDRTTPRLDIIGVPEQMDIISILRERVMYNRSRMNIHEFANYPS